MWIFPSAAFQKPWICMLVLSTETGNFCFIRNEPHHTKNAWQQLKGCVNTTWPTTLICKSERKILTQCPWKYRWLLEFWSELDFGCHIWDYMYCLKSEWRKVERSRGKKKQKEEAIRKNICMHHFIQYTFHATLHSFLCENATMKFDSSSSKDTATSGSFMHWQK